MADITDSATSPDSEKKSVAPQESNDKTLTPKFKAADNGKTQPDTNTSKNDAPTANAGNADDKIKPKFEEVTKKPAEEQKKKKKYEEPPLRELTDPEISSGYRWIKDKDGKITGRAKHSDGQLDFGEAFSKLMHVIALLLSGDEMAPYMIDAIYPSEPKHKDINDILADNQSGSPSKIADTQKEALKRKKEALKEVIEDKNHPDRQLAPEDFVSKYIGDKEAIKAIEPQISKLFDLILSKESKGNLDVVNDYTGGTGLHPGDTTRGGLYVGILLDKDGKQTFDPSRAVERKKFSESTINQVIAWQDKYKDEQRAYYKEHNIRGADGKYKLPSSALGMYQYTGNTLEWHIKEGHIDGNRIFDLDAQTELAAKRLMWRINNATKGSKTIDKVQKNLEKEFKNEWEGLKSKDIKEALSNITREMAENLNQNPEPPQQVAIAPPTITKT